MADYLLDTSVLARCLRGIGETLELTRGLTNQGDLHISTLSHFEILAEAQPREEKRTLDFLAPFLQLAFNAEIAASAARLVRESAQWNIPTFHQGQSGKAAGQAAPSLNPGDAIIAATALQHDLMLVTYQKHNFAHVPALKLYAVEASLRA